MSLLFESYEKDFKREQGKTIKALNNFHLTNDNEKKNMLDFIKRSITSIERSLKQMETEISLKDKTERQRFQPQIKKYRDDYDEVLKKLYNVEKEYMDHLDQQRLFERKDSKAELRDRFVNANEKVYKQNDKFQELNKVAYETENIALGVTANLRGQRDVILNGMNMGRDLGGEIGRADRTMNVLRNKELFSKFLLWCTAILLGIADIAFLIHRIVR